MNVLAIIGLIAAGLVLGFIIGWLARGNSRATRRDIAQQAALSREMMQRQSDSVSDIVLPVISPLEKSLQGFSLHMEQLEQNHLREFSQLTESVVAMQRSSRILSEETGRLSSALRSPNIRGRWGEMQLERVVELSGMAKHCDFSPQHHVHGSNGVQRPDLVIHLSGQRTIVVDAKVPFDSYLTAVNAADRSTQQKAQRACAKAVRTHVDALAKKSYWEAFSSTPEFVVMFLPSDPFLDTVLQEDPSILDYAFSQNVILSTPTTLIALLKTVALTWQHDTITQEAKEIQKLGYELYQRLGTVIQHFTTLVAQLEKAVDSYNSALGSVESRLVVTARKLENYGISPASVVISPEEIDSSPRAVSNKWVSSR